MGKECFDKGGFVSVLEILMDNAYKGREHHFENLKNAALQAQLYIRNHAPRDFLTKAEHQILSDAVQLSDRICETKSPDS